MNNVCEVVVAAITPNWKRRPPLCHPEQLTCLWQIEGEMNKSGRLSFITITPNGKRHSTLEVQSRRDDLKVAQDVSPG